MAERTHGSPLRATSAGPLCHPRVRFIRESLDCSRDNFARTLFWRDRRGDQTWWAVRDGDWKYVREADGGESQQWLFDLALDIGERNSLVSDKPAETARLKRLLHDWEAEVTAAR